MAGAEVGLGGGHNIGRIVADQRAIAFEHRPLAEIIGFLVELALGLHQQRRDIDAARQQPRDAQQRRDIVDIGIDAGGDAGILHLDRQHAAIGQLGAVDLADRCGRDRMRLEMAEAPPPVAPPFGGEHLVELRRGHVVRIVAQPRHDRAQLGREQIARVHRDHLAELHRRTAQMRELVGDARGVGRGQQQITHARPLARRQPPRALRDHPARDAARNPAKAPEARQSPARHRASTPVIRHAACPRLWHGLCADPRGSATHGMALPPPPSSPA